MKAVLLAAGVGSRLRPITDSVPKVMVPVAGTPMLIRNVRWLRAYGVTDLAVNLHYLPDTVVAALGNGAAEGVDVTYSFEKKLLGTAGAVGNLATWLGEDDRFLIVFADNLLNVDLRAMARAHEHAEAIVTIALHWRADTSSSGVAEFGDDLRVHRFVEKPTAGSIASHWVSAGLLLCSSRVLPYIKRGESDIGRDLLPAILHDRAHVGAYCLGEGESIRWIDTMEDLAKCSLETAREEARR